MAQLGEIFEGLSFLPNKQSRRTKRIHCTTNDYTSASKDTVIKTSYRIAVAYITNLLSENGIEQDDYLTALYELLPGGEGIQTSESLSNASAPSSAESDVYSHFIKLCNELKEQHFSFFKDLIINLSLTEDNARTVFMTISKLIYEDAVNWGRIFTLYAFSGTFAVHFGKKGETELVGEIPYWIADVFENYLSDWIINEGGWGKLGKEQNIIHKISEHIPKNKTPIAFAGIAVVGFAAMCFMRLL